MTRSILCLAAALGTLALAPLNAEASVNGCATTLLQSPNDSLYETLQITELQVAQINTIRNDLGMTDDSLALGVRRTAAVMTQWQREQCSSDDIEPVVVVEPTPVIYRTPVVVRRPIYGGYRAPMYRAPERRPAPMYRAPERRPAPMYRAPERRPAPMYRAPARRPAPMYRAPERRPAPMYRAPEHRAPEHRAPAADRTPPAPAGNHGGHRR
jgi:hypothetical protein